MAVVLFQAGVLLNQPAAQGGVEGELVGAVVEQRLDGLPVLLEQALLLGLVRAVEELVAQEVAGRQRDTLGVDALEDELGIVVAVEHHDDGEEPLEAPPHLLELA